MLLILKIPLVYVCVVVWYAIKAEPTPPDVEVGVVADTPPPADRRAEPATGTVGRCVRTHPGSAVARHRLGARPAAETEYAHDRRSTLLRNAATPQPTSSPGFLSVASIVLSLFAMGLGLILEVDARPARTAFVAIILALVSARLSARYQSLALKAALFAMLAWVVGMTLAVLHRRTH